MRMKFVRNRNKSFSIYVFEIWIFFISICDFHPNANCNYMLEIVLAQRNGNNVGRVRSDEIPFPASHQPPPPTPFGEIGCGCLPSSFNEAQSSGSPEFSFQGYFRWKEDIVCFEEPHWDYIPLIPSDKLSLAHTAVFTPHGDMPFCVDVYVFNANDAIPQSPSGAVSQCLCVANVHGKYSQTRR